MIEGATSFTRTGQSSLPPFPDLLDDDRRMYYGTFQFPNLLLNLHPDSAMYYILYPKGPSHTTVVSEYLFRPDTIAAADWFARARQAAVPHVDHVARALQGV